MRKKMVHEMETGDSIAFQVGKQKKISFCLGKGFRGRKVQ